MHPQLTSSISCARAAPRRVACAAVSDARMSSAAAAPTAAATMQDVDETQTAATTQQPLPSPPPGRARASSGARASKHPLLPAAIALGAASSLPLASALTPGSEAKRMRTGEHTPGGSGGAAQWIAETPMSPATTQMQVAMQAARIAPQTPTGTVGTGASSGKLVFNGAFPPSPSRDPAASLPPTHPHPSPSPTAPSHSIFSSTSTHAAAASSVATTAISPSRSGHSSATSSPSSAFSVGAGSHSSGSIPVPTSPVSLSPTAVPHSSATSVASVTPLPIAPASVTTTTPRRTAAAAAAAARHSPAAATYATPSRDIEEDDDEDDGPATGSKKKDGKGQGASCHQCKTAKDEQHLLFCTTKAGGARRRRCRKKYCDSCLARTYGVDVKALMSSSELSTWSCPSCLGKCTCAGCSRKTTRGGGAGGRASHAASTSLAIPPALLETVAAPQKKLTKAQQAQLARDMQNEQKIHPAGGASGSHYLPAPHAAFGALPAAGGYGGRAISAPLHDSYMQHAYQSSQQQQLHAYEAAAAAAVANAAKLEAAAASRPPMLDSTAAAPSSSDQDTSPVHLDLIASMLLELTGASSASSSAPATVSAPHSTEMAGASSSSHTAAPAPLLPAQPALTHLSPPKTAMPASMDPMRMAALRASGGRPMMSGQPSYQNPAPFAFAGGGGSFAGSAGVGGSGPRFPSHSPVSLLQSSSSMGLRSSSPGSHLPLKYASLLSGGGGGMTLPGAPPRDQRAQSETTLMSGATVAGWKRAYETTQETNDTNQ